MTASQIGFKSDLDLSQLTDRVRLARPRETGPSQVGSGSDLNRAGPARARPLSRVYTRRKLLMASRELHEIETLLDACVRSMGRTLRNVVELAESGLPSSTPGNGSPGGGKGGGRTVVIDDERYPTTSVEAAVLDPVLDTPSVVRDQLLAELVRGEQLSAEAMMRWFGKGPLRPAAGANAVQLVTQQMRCARLLVSQDASTRPRAWMESVVRLHGICSTWGFDPAVPVKPRELDVLAVDNTERWCRSCLRVGTRSPRDTSHPGSEMCQWCRKFVLAEGFVPPASIVAARFDPPYRVTEAMIVPFRQAHRERAKRLTKGRRRGRKSA